MHGTDAATLLKHADTAMYHAKETGRASYQFFTEQMNLAVVDGCKRLLFPGMETEVRLSSKKKADAEAIKVFADNIRELPENILYVDLHRPGLRVQPLSPARRAGAPASSTPLTRWKAIWPRWKRARRFGSA